MLETLANLGEFIGAIGVVVTIGYLALQIRQNTRAVRSASYHQAAEQTWSACLAVAQSPDLAEILVRAQAGKPLGPVETMRLVSQDAAMIFGFENMARLYEEGLIDAEVYRNVIDNSVPYLGSPRVQELLRGRRGPLSARLAEEVARRVRELGLPTVDPHPPAEG